MVQGTVDAVHLFPRLLLSVPVPMGLQNMALEMMEAATQGLRAHSTYYRFIESSIW